MLRVATSGVSSPKASATTRNHTRRQFLGEARARSHWHCLNPGRIGEQTVSDEGFTIRTKRWSGVVWAPIGLAFLGLAVDLKFLHLIPGATEDARSWLVFLILSAIGSGILFPAMRAILKPRTLLAVDRSGITISAAGDHSEWNNDTGKMESIIRYGDERHIPWSLVERIESGTIESVTESHRRGTIASQTETSTTRIGGETVRHVKNRPALRFLCSREVSMDAVSTRNLIQARTGDARSDLPLSELTHLSPDELDDLTLSEFLIDTRLLPAPVDSVVTVMRTLSQA